MPDMILHLKRHDAASIPKFKQHSSVYKQATTGH